MCGPVLVTDWGRYALRFSQHNLQPVSCCLHLPVSDRYHGLRVVSDHGPQRGANQVLSDCSEGRGNISRRFLKMALSLEGWTGVGTDSWGGRMSSSSPKVVGWYRKDQG